MSISELCGDPLGGESNFIRRGGFSSLFTLSPLYTCREFSTNQLLFMQNKPNLVRRRRIANSVCTRNYEIFLPLAGQKNKPNSNPIKPNLRKAKMNINSIITKDYRKKDDFEVRINKPNSNPISEKPKMNVNLYVIEDYENETAFRLQKNKPNQTQFPKGQNECKLTYNKGLQKKTVKLEPFQGRDGTLSCRSSL